jgi:trans-aconitate methyltransferase
VAEAEGFDFSSRMLSLAKSSVPSVKWNLADIRSVMLPTRSFDAVVLSGCLSHLLAREATKLLIESVHAIREVDCCMPASWNPTECAWNRAHSNMLRSAEISRSSVSASVSRTS